MSTLANAPISRELRGRMRLAGAAVQRARLTVVPRRPSTARRTPFVVLVALMLIVGVGGLLAFNTNMQQSAFTNSALQAQSDALAAQQQSLQMDLQRLRDPQRLATRAKRLGLVPAPAPAFIELRNGRVLGTPTPATSADAMAINPPAPAKPKALAPKPRVVKVVAPRRASTASAGTGGKNNKHTQHSGRH